MEYPHPQVVINVKDRLQRTRAIYQQVKDNRVQSNLEEPRREQQKHPVSVSISNWLDLEGRRLLVIVTGRKPTRWH